MPPVSSETGGYFVLHQSLPCVRGGGPKGRRGRKDEKDDPSVTVKAVTGPFAQGSLRALPRQRKLLLRPDLVQIPVDAGLGAMQGCCCVLDGAL